MAYRVSADTVTETCILKMSDKGKTRLTSAKR